MSCAIEQEAHPWFGTTPSATPGPTPMQALLPQQHCNVRQQMYTDSDQELPMINKMSLTRFFSVSSSEPWVYVTYTQTRQSLQLWRPQAGGAARPWPVIRDCHKCYIAFCRGQARSSWILGWTKTKLLATHVAGWPAPLADCECGQGMPTWAPTGCETQTRATHQGHQRCTLFCTKNARYEKFATTQQCVP